MIITHRIIGGRNLPSPPNRCLVLMYMHAPRVYYLVHLLSLSGLSSPQMFLPLCSKYQAAVLPYDTDSNTIDIYWTRARLLQVHRLTDLHVHEHVRILCNVPQLGGPNIPTRQVWCCFSQFAKGLIPAGMRISTNATWRWHQPPHIHRIRDSI